MTILAILLVLFPTVALAMSAEAEGHIERQLRSARIPSAAVAVVQGGEVSFVLKESSMDTLYSIQSLSKPFTAFGVLLLEDMGLLCISDPVNQHLPWFSVQHNGAPVPHEDLTIYNLIHHTSGISANENRFPRADLSETTDEFISRLIDMELDFEPSTDTAYSNMAYMILGLLIESVSGQSYDEFMTQNVLHPLGLYDTFTDVERAWATGRVAGGHGRGFFLILRETRVLYRHVTEIPAGGIHSGIADLARWAGIHLGTVEVSEQFARVVQRSHMLKDGGYFHDGGWNISLVSGFEHGGQGAGYSVAMRISTENNTAVVVLSNLRYINIENIREVAYDAAISGVFNNRRIDMHEITDTLLTILCIVGIVYAVLIVKQAIKLRKKLRGGYVLRFEFSINIIKSFVGGPLLSIAFLISYYAFPYVFFDTTRNSILTNWPISFGVATAAIWIMVIHDIFVWGSKHVTASPMRRNV
ncbi:MAG: beta-lactamase family protein [Defluviitaleaceae bacterium]|nr:beta-lactamase family protein [Defluviitaleaceae bacterium]